MSECDRFREMTLERDRADDVRFQRHAARCADCREQLNADRELRRLFEGIAQPGPSLHFGRVLRQRLRAERQRQQRQRWRLFVMLGYWVAAVAACGIVVSLVRWPSELPPAPVAGLFGAVLGMTLLAPAVLLLTLRIGPLDLIAKTVQALRR